MNRHTALLAGLLTTAFTNHVLAQDDATGSDAKNRSADSKTGIAVVELFTSQGCNSCPPADALLKKITDAAKHAQLRVYTLSFHVDYWNRLGWSDPYSDRQFSQRQNGYASASGSRRVYTPQMIVSGSKEFVGSNKALAHQSISASLDRQPKHLLQLTPRANRAGDPQKIDYQVTGVTNGKLLNIAVVTTPPPNKVPRGENSGRTLEHVNVVRVFRVINLKQTSGSIEVTLPSNLKPSDARIIGYVQDQRTLQITGATAIPLAVEEVR